MCHNPDHVLLIRIEICQTHLTKMLNEQNDQFHVTTRSWIDFSIFSCSIKLQPLTVVYNSDVMVRLSEFFRPSHRSKFQVKTASIENKLQRMLMERYKELKDSTKAEFIHSLDELMIGEAKVAQCKPPFIFEMLYTPSVVAWHSWLRLMRKGPSSNPSLTNVVRHLVFNHIRLNWFRTSCKVYLFDFLLPLHHSSKLFFVKEI